MDKEINYIVIEILSNGLSDYKFTDRDQAVDKYRKIINDSSRDEFIGAAVLKHDVPEDNWRMINVKTKNGKQELFSHTMQNYYSELNNKLNESTDNEEWEAVVKKYCRKIGAEVLFINDYDFGYMLPNGQMIHKYADELQDELSRLDEDIPDAPWVRNAELYGDPRWSSAEDSEYTPKTETREKWKAIIKSEDGTIYEDEAIFEAELPEEEIEQAFWERSAEGDEIQSIEFVGEVDWEIDESLRWVRNVMDKRTPTTTSKLEGTSKQLEEDSDEDISKSIFEGLDEEDTYPLRYISLINFEGNDNGLVSKSFDTKEEAQDFINDYDLEDAVYAEIFDQNIGKTVWKWLPGESSENNLFENMDEDEEEVDIYSKYADLDDDESRYEYIKSKSVLDSDGFYTDYTMYKDNITGNFVFVFGDNDVYTPEDEDFDYVAETKSQADEWFANYNGFDEDMDEAFNEFANLDKKKDLMAWNSDEESDDDYYDAKHAAEYTERHPYGYYNSEKDYDIDESVDYDYNFDELNDDFDDSFNKLNINESAIFDMYSEIKSAYPEVEMKKYSSHHPSGTLLFNTIYIKKSTIPNMDRFKEFLNYLFNKSLKNVTTIVSNISYNEDRWDRPRDYIRINWIESKDNEKSRDNSNNNDPVNESYNEYDDLRDLSDEDANSWAREREEAEQREKDEQNYLTEIANELDESYKIDEVLNEDAANYIKYVSDRGDEGIFKVSDYGKVVFPIKALVEVDVYKPKYHTELKPAIISGYKDNGRNYSEDLIIRKKDYYDYLLLNASLPNSKPFGEFNNFSIKTNQIKDRDKYITQASRDEVVEYLKEQHYRWSIDGNEPLINIWESKKSLKEKLEKNQINEMVHTHQSGRYNWTEDGAGEVFQVEEISSGHTLELGQEIIINGMVLYISGFKEKTKDVYLGDKGASLKDSRDYDIGSIFRKVYGENESLNENTQISWVKAEDLPIGKKIHYEGKEYEIIDVQDVDEVNPDQVFIILKDKNGKERKITEVRNRAFTSVHDDWDYGEWESFENILNAANEYIENHPEDNYIELNFIYDELGQDYYEKLSNEEKKQLSKLLRKPIINEYHQIDMTDEWGGTRSCIVKAQTDEEARNKAEKAHPNWKYRATYVASEADVDWAKRHKLYVESIDEAMEPVQLKDENGDVLVDLTGEYGFVGTDAEETKNESADETNTFDWSKVRNVDSLGKRIYDITKTGYCVAYYYFHQYTEGITGQNRFSYLLLNSDGQGFTKKSDAVKLKNKLNEIGIKNYTKKGRDTGYGEVGAEEQKVWVIPVVEADKSDWYYNWNYIAVDQAALDSLSILSGLNKSLNEDREDPMSPGTKLYRVARKYGFLDDIELARKIYDDPEWNEIIREYKDPLWSAASDVERIVKKYINSKNESLAEDPTDSWEEGKEGWDEESIFTKLKRKYGKKDLKEAFPDDYIYFTITLKDSEDGSIYTETDKMQEYQFYGNGLDKNEEELKEWFRDYYEPDEIISVKQSGWSSNESLNEGTFSDLDTEIRDSEGIDKLIYKTEKNVKALEDEERFLINQAPREIKKGGAFDSQEEIDEALEETRKELSKERAKLRMLRGVK